MPALHEVQQSFAHGVVTGEFDAIAGAVQEDRIEPAGRLQIYRNHFLITLVDILGGTFATVRSLLGAASFDAHARRFAMLAPPEEPRLTAYGAGFSSYLREAPELASLPYLPDVARLDWCVNRALHAPDAIAIDGPGDSPSEPTRLVLHPSCHLLASRFPLVAIHAASCHDADPEEHVDLDDGDTRLLVFRDGDDVAWVTLEPASYAFLCAVRAGRTLDAAVRISSVDEAELAGLLGFLFRTGLVVGFDHQPITQTWSPVP